MATELEQRTTQITETKRGIFSRMSDAPDTEYRKPIFRNLSFEDTSTINVQKHYTSQTEQISVDSARKVDMLTIDKQIEQHTETPVKVHLNAHGRILISVIAICICALVAFMIGNAVTIGSLSSQVSAKSQVVYEQQLAVNDLQNQYEVITEGIESAARDAGLTGDLSGATELVPVEDLVRPTAQIETNWFDNLCNFLSHIFG